MKRLTDFFSKEYHRLVAFVRNRIDDAADRDAEDIVMDVMLGLFEKANVARPVEDLSAYVFQSLRNRIVDLFRTRKMTVALSDFLQDSRYDTAGEVEKKELQEKVYNSINNLNDEQRAVVIATEFKGISYRDLSEQWGIPVGTLLARKSRALKKIKNEMNGLVNS
ncbi:MAG: sigma-70 family RNA polymerase sigma factor [Candidatus Aminicenantes bacterium]|jgi:RNA polymerase sigma factor (sigma-70 family)|nr:sigma-70 family RNA polymerase sigma factor [Candidatus Aminicenantes bacterium]